MRRLTFLLAVLAFAIAAKVAAQDGGTHRANTAPPASAWCEPGSGEPRHCYEDRSRCEAIVGAENELDAAAAALTSSGSRPPASAAPRVSCEPLPRRSSCFAIREGMHEPLASTLMCFATAAACIAAQRQQRAPPHLRDMIYQVTHCAMR